MKKSRFTESQIVAILKETDAGMKVAEVCRKHGISQPTYYNWKSKYGGMTPAGRSTSCKTSSPAGGGSASST